MMTPAVGKWKQMALVIMLIIGTVLHGISVADIYWPALVKAGSLLIQMIQ